MMASGWVIFFAMALKALLIAIYDKAKERRHATRN